MQVALVLGFSGQLVASQRPVIRIGHIHTPGVNTFLPIEFMMEQFRNSTNRTVLPDFDVVIEPLPIEIGTQEASARVVEALMSPEPFHAITGPGTNIDCLDVVDLAATAKILNIQKGINVEFLDRQRYPYVFRVTRSFTIQMRLWFSLLTSANWFTVLCMLVDTPSIDLVNVLASERTISSYSILAEAGEEWLTQAWQQSAISTIRQYRMRAIFTYFDTEENMYSFACTVHRDKIGGLQYFQNPFYDPLWFKRSFDASLGDCTATEIKEAVAGVLTTLHVPVAPGIILLGRWFPTIPGVVGDQSNTPLSCLSDWTADAYMNNPEYLLAGVAAGIVVDDTSAARYIGLGAQDYDLVCLTMMTLHDAIYNKNVDLGSIERREASAFEELIDSVGKQRFWGLAGEFFFENEQGPDPGNLYFIVTQYALPDGWRKADSEVYIIGRYAFPDGPEGEPHLVLESEDEPIYWRDRSSGAGDHSDLEFFDDCGARNAVLIWDSCVDCLPGRFYDQDAQLCRTCARGDYQNEAAQSACHTALPGWYIADTEEPIVAVECPAGHECPSIGTVTPQLCNPGTFANDTGHEACQYCPVGEFQNEPGQIACKRCSLRGSTTVNIASTDEVDCVCPAGSYRPLVGGCVGCLEGMTCEEGSDMRYLLQGGREYPKVAEGYMTLPWEPLVVYACKAEQQCPGGDPGTCASHRDPTTVACGDCLDEAFEVGDDCEPCGDATALPIVIALISGGFMVIAATILINKDVHKTPAASFMIIAITGMLFTSLQALGIFSQMVVPWVEPVKTVLSLSQLLSFDLKLLKVSCVMGVNPVRAFAVRQCVALCAIPFIFVSLLGKKYAPIVRKPQTRVAVELANAVGTLYSLFFISIVISALNPFLCYKHPGDSGESVLSASSLLCFDSGEHTAMITISLIAMIAVPIPFMVLCSYGILMYPKHIAAHDSSSFLHAMRFLFFRYKPQRYYFQIILLFRSLLVCLIPAILRGQPSTQVLFMCLVLFIYVAVEAGLKPWRAGLCNPLDAILNLMLATMLTCGALFLEDTPQRETVAALTTAAIIALLVLAVAGLFIALLQRFAPQRYDYFICHHKAHAAAQARYLKILFQTKRRRTHVFIDSDDLQQLDTLFDTVKSRVRHLVVLLTADTLKRPWCAGEIVSSLRAQIQITRLQTPSFVMLTEEQYEHMDKYVDSAGCNLSEYGIEWEHVAEAFREFLTTIPQMDLSTTALGTHKFDLASGMLLKMRVAEEEPRRLDQVTDCGILVATDVASDEANASAGILVARITKDVFQLCEQSIVMLGNYVPSLEWTQELIRQAQAVVILLSPGCLDSVFVLTSICELQQTQGQAGAPGAISVNAGGFAFPATSVLDEVSRRHEKLTSRFGNACPDLVKSFFKNISILLPTHASQDALDTQSDEIFRRIAQFVTGTRGSVRGSNNSIRNPVAKTSQGTLPSIEAKASIDVEVVDGSEAAQSTEATRPDAGGAPIRITFEEEM